jgi:hypothetical protein
MIEQSPETELSVPALVQRVQGYLQHVHLDGITLEVDPEVVQKGEFSWRVCVRPSEEPTDRIEYYEALADVEMELEEQEQLQVWLVPGDPKHPQIAGNPPQVAQDKASQTHRSRRLKRRLRGTKQLVAQKVVEYLRDCHPGGVILEVDVDRIRKEDYWWEVPVRPDVEPRKKSEYYEAILAVQDALEARERLSVFLLPGEPKEEQAQ